MIEVKSYTERLFKQYMLYLVTESKAYKADIHNSIAFQMITGQIRGPTIYILRLLAVSAGVFGGGVFCFFVCFILFYFYLRIIRMYIKRLLTT